VERSIRRLAALVRERRPCVVLTGAGISTESGIPDFRSPTGIWARYDPQEYATISAYRRDPAKVWEFYARRFGALADAQPNEGHRVLARLERAGVLEAVVTQNVDGLHQLAGSQEVVEVHGSLRSASCTRCTRRVPSRDVLAQVEDVSVTSCPACGAVLKPDVVMFGELLPPAVVDRAFELVQRAGLLLVVGSSLEVHPVAGLPADAVAAGAAHAILNLGATPSDHLASLRIDAGAGETLAALERELA
jgi:NAD-dependent deacetylase